MPELPEVETVVKDLNANLPKNTAIKGAKVFWPKIIATQDPELFNKLITKSKINKIWRRAKYIVIDLNNGLHMIVHLRMTGHLLIINAKEPRNKHEHVIIELSNGTTLRYHDTRKFGRFYVTDDLDTFFANIGPEPLGKDFSAAILGGLLAGKTRKLKPLLLDQSMVAGLGNIYVDEALWQAKLHPQTKACHVKPQQVKALYAAIVKVLQCGIDNMGTTLGTGAANYYSVSGRRGRNSDALKVFRRQGQACPRCGTIITKFTCSQRGTHVCPKCQPVK